MSVIVRPYRRGGWEVDIRVRLPDGTERRERKRAPATSRTAALRWGEARERTLLIHGAPQPKKDSESSGHGFSTGIRERTGISPVGLRRRRRSARSI
jgi:hypothetical protein